MSGIGACHYSANGDADGVALGYITGDVVEGGSGNLILTYTNGHCATEGMRGVVYVYFRCGDSVVSSTHKIIIFNRIC